MRKQGLNPAGYPDSDRHYPQNIVPKTRRVNMPILERAKGEIVQDSTDIIRHLETQEVAKQCGFCRV